MQRGVVYRGCGLLRPIVNFAEILCKTRDVGLQAWQIVLDDIPNQQEVHAPVAMNETISECDNLLPDRTGSVAGCRREAVGSLADDFKLRMTASWISRSCRNVSRPPAT